MIGEARSGSARWINLGIFTLQPSEFAKIALIMTLSSIISLKRNSLSGAGKIAKIFLMSSPIFIFVLIQPDLGTTVVLFSILVTTLFYAGISKWYFIISSLFFGIFSAPIWGFLKDYQQRRILVFLNPALDVLGSGYNVIQALIAVGSGGLFGKGFSHGTQSQLNFLPAHWTDFAFASFAEEWGFVGVLTLMILFLLLLLIILHVLYKTKDSYGSFLCVGAFTVFFVQFIVNVGMNLGVMPVTGIPLPFISYGGSSLLASFILLGIVQSVIIYSYAESYRIS
jgi:rod shape determining protein RodA